MELAAVDTVLGVPMCGILYGVLAVRLSGKPPKDPLELAAVETVPGVPLHGILYGILTGTGGLLGARGLLGMVKASR